MGLSSYFTRMWTWCGCCELFETCCILGRTPRIKKTLSDFREWCWVTRHPRVLRGLTGCQRDTPILGCHIFFQINILLLVYQEFGYKSLNIPKMVAHNLLFPFNYSICLNIV